LAAFVSSVGLAHGQYRPAANDIIVVESPAPVSARAVLGAPQIVPETSAPAILQIQAPNGTPAPAAETPPIVGPLPETRGAEIATEEGQPAEEAGLGPTPLPKVGILQGLLFGDNAD
jgi:hypothetical protein